MEYTICSLVAHYEQASGWFVDLCRHVHSACMHVCTYPCACVCVCVCVTESQFNSIQFNLFCIHLILSGCDPSDMEHYITWSSVLLLIIAKGTSHTSVDPADHEFDPENGENIIFVIQSYMGSINMEVVKSFISHELSLVRCELTMVCFKNPGSTRAGLLSSVL